MTQGPFGEHRTRIIRWKKTYLRIRHRELSAYQYSKRYKRHNYRRPYYHDHPTVDQRGFRDGTGKLGCDVVYIPYGFTWVPAQDPRC
jgi:hypothetical protein